ncbi:Uncharacterised protein [Lysinibacillus capsici]|uniref:Uncharacterized protein n=1 Tax=Lysinibacillus capsici TaxID=2115968 RepID=A0A2X1AJE1_9BACI|nr:Uncharacterised protein [Lysinibacillus capsici]
MYSLIEILFLMLLVICLANFNLQYIQKCAEGVRLFSTIVNLPLYTITVISLILLLIMPLSSGYFFIGKLFRLTLLLLIVTVMMLLPLNRIFNKSSKNNIS